MTVPSAVSWDVILNEELQDLGVAFGMLMEAAEAPNEPPGYLAKMIRQVLAIHPKYTPVVISKYADLLSAPELELLSQQFECVKVFLTEYAPAFEAMKI